MRRMLYESSLAGLDRPVPDAGLELQAGLWNWFGRHHPDGAQVGHIEISRRGVRVQPQHRLQRQRLLPEVGRGSPFEVSAEHSGREHWRSAVDTARLQ